MGLKIALFSGADILSALKGDGSFKADHGFVVYRNHSHRFIASGYPPHSVRPAIDHGLCLQPLTPILNGLGDMYNVYCPIQISVYYLLSVRTLEQASLYPSIFMYFPTQGTLLRGFSSSTSFTFIPYSCALSLIRFIIAR